MLPQLERALIAGHDVVLLGERGQGKTRAAAHPGRPDGRVDPRHRRLRARRAPVRTDHARVPAPGGAARRRPAGDLAAPRREVRREAGHAGHLGRGPDRRRRPDEGRRGAHPGRPGHHPLRADPALPPGDRGHQRAARPRGADPGGDAQRDGGAGHPDPRVRPPAAPRRAGDGERQPRGLHQPRADHHAAQGPLRGRDPHPLPARGRRRDRGHPAGGAPRRDGARPPRRDPGPLHPRAARVQRRRPALRASAPGSPSRARRPSPRPPCTAPSARARTTRSPGSSTSRPPSTCSVARSSSSRARRAAPARS